MRYNVYSKRVSVLFPRLYRPDDCANCAQCVCVVRDGGRVPCRRRVCVYACIGVCHPFAILFVRPFVRSFASLAPPPNEFLRAV